MISLSASAAFGKTGQYIAHITGRDSKWTFNREFIGRKCGKRNEGSEADVDTPGLYEMRDVDRKNNKDDRYVIILEIDGELCKFMADKEDAMKIGKELDGGRTIQDIVVGHLEDAETKEAMEDSVRLERMLINSPSEQQLAQRITIASDVGEFKTGETVEQGKLQPVIKAELEKAKAKHLQLRAQGKYAKRFYVLIDKKEAEAKKAAATVDEATNQCWVILQALPQKEAKKVLAALKDKVTPPKEKPAEQPESATA